MLPCPCGHPFPTVRHEGKASQLLYPPSMGAITPKAFDDVVSSDEVVVAYRIRQQTATRFHFAYILDERTSPTSGSDLESRVRKAIGPGAVLSAARVDYIPTERSGKFFSCVSNAEQERATFK